MWGQLCLSSYEEPKPFSTSFSWTSCKPQEEKMRSGKPQVRSEWKSFSLCTFFPWAVSWLNVWNDSDCQLQIPDSVISTNLNVFFSENTRLHTVVLFYILKVFLLSSAVVHLRNHLHHDWRITSSDNMLVWVTSRSQPLLRNMVMADLHTQPCKEIGVAHCAVCHTHTHVRISIFVGTFIEITHYLAGSSSNKCPNYNPIPDWP